MDTILRVVGLVGDGKIMPLVAPPQTSRNGGPRSEREVVEDISAVPVEDLALPDLARVAAATERGILALEDEARSLERLSLPDAVALVRRWTRSLKRKQRSDEPLASFRAQFMRSNAMEKALEALRRNHGLLSELLDPPLFASPRAVPEDTLEAALHMLLQQCLPKAVGFLAAPLLRAILLDRSECNIAAALTTIRLLKEDWTEVVHAQAIKVFEHRLDSLAYELQKMPMVRNSQPVATPDTTPALLQNAAKVRQTSHSQVLVLALLCEALEKAQRQADTRLNAVRGSLQKLGVDVDHQTTSPKSTSSSSDGRCSEKEHGPGIAAVSGSGHAAVADAPAVAFFEDASAQRERAQIACGLSRVNSASGEIVLPVMRRADSRGGGGWAEAAQSLAEEQARLVREREEHLEQLRNIEERLLELDQMLSRPAHGQPCKSANALSPELDEALAGAAEAVASKAQHVREQNVARLQLRRRQLVGCLVAHLDGERDRLSALAASLSEVAATGVATGAAAAGATAAVTEVLQETRNLCGRVAEIAGGLCHEHRRIAQNSGPRKGQRCRAKWVDGNLYDATVQKLAPDGSIVVNWLRPRPMGAAGESSPMGRPLVTISEAGGDDSLHRIVPLADVFFDGAELGEVSCAVEALALFERRPAEDLQCADCGAACPEWASISFGTYLCRMCAGEHQSLGPSLSLVRQLSDGWGWNHQELRYLSNGGNAACHAYVDQYPVAQALPLAQKYSSRVAENYRRHLDALCVGLPAPLLLAVDGAEQHCPGEFVSAVEAMAIVREASQRFEEAAMSAIPRGEALNGAFHIALPPPNLLASGLYLHPSKFNKVSAC